MQLKCLLFAVCLVMAAGTTPLHAEHVVWSGLVIAQNVPQPAPIPPELTKLEQTLKELFGYNQFELIGQSSKTLKTGEEDWLANSKYFGLHVDARGENEAGYTLNLKLYKENDVLLETELSGRALVGSRKSRESSVSFLGSLGNIVPKCHFGAIL